MDVGPYKLLNKQPNDLWLETTWRSWDVILMINGSRAFTMVCRRPALYWRVYPTNYDNHNLFYFQNPTRGCGLIKITYQTIRKIKSQNKANLPKQWLLNLQWWSEKIGMLIELTPSKKVSSYGVFGGLSWYVKSLCLVQSILIKTYYGTTFQVRDAKHLSKMPIPNSPWPVPLRLTLVYF